MLVCSTSSLKNLESDRVRPEVVVFRELDTLVRNLGDQVAGYRRRALAGEARTKELQTLVDSYRSQLEDVRADAELAIAARDTSHAREHHAALREGSLREALLAADRARAQAELALAQFHAERAAAAELAAAIPPPAATLAEVALTEENERLRMRLLEARERTTQLVDRLKFLRQQMTQGVER